VANPNAAAVDIGCAEHWVCVPAGRSEKPTRCFGCCTDDLNQLADWLVECGVKRIAVSASILRSPDPEAAAAALRAALESCTHA